MTSSYIVVEKATGKAIFETFNQHLADTINTEKYEMIEAGKYLAQLNRKIREGKA